MSKLRVFVLVSSVFAFFSCKSSPSGPATILTANIKGRVISKSSFITYTPPYSGITVKFLGTNMSATTDDSGYYNFYNVPQGTYNVRVSKSGYGDILWKSVTITGGGTEPINWVYGPESYVTLTQISSTVATLTNAYVGDTIPVQNYPQHTYLIVEGSVSPLVPYMSRTAVYLSHTSDVSSTPGHYTTFFYMDWFVPFDDAPAGAYSSFDTATSTFRHGYPLDKIKSLGFKSGDSIYVAAYGAPYYGFTPTNDYFDPDLQEYVLTALNPTPSPVIGLTMP